MPENPTASATATLSKPITPTSTNETSAPVPQEREKTLPQRLQDLVEKISPSDKRGGERLRRLATALGEHSSADVWAFANLAQVANGDQISAQYAGSLVAKDKDKLKRWESLRNASIFLPLILTWVGIADAAGRFYYLVHSGKASDMASFLYLWEGGFGGDTSLTLSHIAFFDVALLIGIAIFTLIVMARSFQLARLEQDSTITLRLEIDDVLADVDLELARFRLPQPYASISKLESMANILHSQIKIDGENIVALATQKEKELNILAAFTPQLANSSGKMLAAAERIEQAQGRLAKVLDDLGNPVSVLCKREDELLEAVRISNAKFDGLQQQQQTISKLLADITRSQATLVGEANAQMQQLTNAISKMTPVVDQFAQASTDLANAQTQMLQQLSAERGEQTKLTQAITHAESGLENAANRVNQSATDVSKLASELSKLAQALPGVVQGLERVSSLAVSNGSQPR